MAPVKKAFAHNYFHTSDGNYSKCKLCNAYLKNRSDGSTCNMNRHIQEKHCGVIDLPPVHLDTPLNEKPKISTPITTPPNFPPLNINPSVSAYSISSNIISSNTNEITFNVEDFKLIHPFSLIVSGPTSSGKSTLLFQILDNLHQNTTPVIEKVVYIYGIYQEVFKNYPNIIFTDNLDFMDCSTEVPTVIILDDLMSVLNNSKKLEELFTPGVHHRKVSVVLTLFFFMVV